MSRASLCEVITRINGIAVWQKSTLASAKDRECRNLAAWPGSPARRLLPACDANFWIGTSETGATCPGATQDSYAIWVSEIMLQQTRVAVVVDRYQAFMERFPTLVSLALAPEQDVLALWSGLGYYRRARMLHKAAQFVADNLQGNLPATCGRVARAAGDWRVHGRRHSQHRARRAGGRGRWQRGARAVPYLAVGKSASRVGAAALRRKVEELAARTRRSAIAPATSTRHSWNLGATVCLPRNPQCLVCPVSADCKTRGEHKTPPRASHAEPRSGSRALGSASGRPADPGATRSAAGTAFRDQTVMPGMWELPVVARVCCSEKDLRMTVRHAIMQVNYYVRIRTVFEDDIDAMTVAGGATPLGSVGRSCRNGAYRASRARCSRQPCPPELQPPSTLDAMCGPFQSAADVRLNRVNALIPVLMSSASAVAS